MRSFLLLLLLPVSLLRAQPNNHHKYLSIAFTNAHTARPFGSFSSLFYKDFHPGIEAGYGSILKKAKNHMLSAELRMGYLYHRWVQHNIAFSLNGGYHYKISSWSVGVKPGIGYQLSIPDSKVFEITGNNLEAKGNVLRSQFIANVGLSVDKQINDRGMKIMLEYQQRLQTPFINEYVPLLPYNILFIGFSMPLK
jgi:hypothetical protein